MPRTRELQYGRARQWQDRMAERVTLGNGEQLDMLDPKSIRAYVRRQLALNCEPTAPQLRRLEMLNELATELEQTTKASPTGDGKLRLVDAQQAAEVLRKRLEQK